MLQGYIDDSSGAGVLVLGGWVARKEVWKKFSLAWDDILNMSPRISYFKYAEAKNQSGEFNGISTKSRDLKLRLFVRCIEEYGLVGVT